MPKTIDRAGQRYGRLVAVRFLNKEEGGSRWLCQCDCGNTTLVAGSSLGARVNSCGCWRKETAGPRGTTHGMSKSPEYGIYIAAKKRCTNPNDKHYSDYGGRGIMFKFDSFQAFFAELGERPSNKHSVDRINNNGHYEPGNVRWSVDQARNRRSNRMLVYQGRTQCMADWADELGLSPDLIKDRLTKLGWTIEKALTTPPRKLADRPKP